jgi:hypothetical protein
MATAMIHTASTASRRPNRQRLFTKDKSNS